MADETVESMTTHELNLCAFAMARGAKMTDWELSDGQAVFTVSGRAADHRSAFFSLDENVNIQKYINARNMLLDMIKHAR